ncbi:hypothetical protein NKG05_30830 [Oerskovia sp. M15]
MFSRIVTRPTAFDQHTSDALRLAQTIRLAQASRPTPGRGAHREQRETKAPGPGRLRHHVRDTGSREVRRTASVLAALVLLSGCGTPASTVAIGEQTFTVEVADTPDAQRTGLSDRDDVPAAPGCSSRSKARTPRGLDGPHPGPARHRLDPRRPGHRHPDPATMRARRRHQLPDLPSPGDVDTLLEVPAGNLRASPRCRRQGGEG